MMILNDMDSELHLQMVMIGIEVKRISKLIQNAIYCNWDAY